MSITRSIASTVDRGLERAELEGVGAADRERAAAEPEQPRLEDVGLERGVLEMAHHLAALDEDLLGQGDADRLPGHGLFRGLGHMPGLDRLDLAVLFDGENTTSSPTCSRPASIRPAMIRRWSNL